MPVSALPELDDDEPVSAAPLAPDEDEPAEPVSAAPLPVALDSGVAAPVPAEPDPASLDSLALLSWLPEPVADPPSGLPLASLPDEPASRPAAELPVSGVPDDAEPDDSLLGVPVPDSLDDDSLGVVGVWAGAFSVNALPPVLVVSPCALGLCARRSTRSALLVVLRPGNAWAATPVKIPVSAALPASSQRLAWPSLRSAASRVRLVWVFLGDIALGGATV